MSRDTPPHCVLGPRPGRYARRYRLSAPALWHPSRGHPCAARMQTQLNTLRLQSSIFLATSCWNQPGPLCPLMAVMSVAGHWPVPLHMRQPSTSNSQLPLTAPGSHRARARVRLRRWLVLVRECFRPGDWWGTSLPLQATSTAGRRSRATAQRTAGRGRGAPREAIGLPAGQPDCTPLPGRGHNLPPGTNRSDSKRK